MSLSRPLAGAVSLLLVLGSGCATTGAALRSDPTAARLAIDAAQVPPAPETASPAVADAWGSARGATLEAAAGQVAGLALVDSSSAEGRALAGFLALRRGDLGAAQDAFGTAMAARAEMPEAAYGMGLVAQGRGDVDLARQWYSTALRSAPGLTRADVAMRRLDLAGIDELLAAAENATAAGDLGTAESQYREAIRLSPGIAGSYVQLARLYERSGERARAIDVLSDGLRNVGDSPALLEPVAALYREAGRLAEASDAFERLRAASPGDARVEALARAARDEYERAALPAEYRALASKPVVSREDLAAILAINLGPLEAFVDAGGGVIIGDVGNGWSAPFIRRMVSWGVLDVYQNNFMPRMIVRRSMLVEACYRVLEILGVADSAPRRPLDDPPPEHLLYRPTQVAVGLGLIQPDRDGSVDLLAPVSGAEALRTVERLAALVRREAS